MRKIEITKTNGHKDSIDLLDDDEVSLDRTRVSSSLEIRRITHGVFDVNSTYSKFWTGYVHSDPNLISKIEYVVNGNVHIKVEEIDSLFYSAHDVRGSDMKLIPGIREVVKFILR